METEIASLINKVVGSKVVKAADLFTLSFDTFASAVKKIGYLEIFPEKISRVSQRVGAIQAIAKHLADSNGQKDAVPPEDGFLSGTEECQIGLLSLLKGLCVERERIGEKNLENISRSVKEMAMERDPWAGNADERSIKRVRGLVAALKGVKVQAVASFDPPNFDDFLEVCSVVFGAPFGLGEGLFSGEELEAKSFWFLQSKILFVEEWLALCESLGWKRPEAFSGAVFIAGTDLGSSLDVIAFLCAEARRNTDAAHRARAKEKAVAVREAWNRRADVLAHREDTVRWTDKDKVRRLAKRAAESLHLAGASGVTDADLVLGGFSAFHGAILALQRARPLPPALFEDGHLEVPFPGHTEEKVEFCRRLVVLAHLLSRGRGDLTLSVDDHRALRRSALDIVSGVKLEGVLAVYPVLCDVPPKTSPELPALIDACLAPVPSTSRTHLTLTSTATTPRATPRTARPTPTTPRPPRDSAGRAPDRDDRERERIERERIERERIEKEKERIKIERDRLDKDRDRLERDRLERDRLERDRLERDRLERDRLERDRLDREKERDRLERARLEREEEEERERRQRARAKREAEEREREREREEREAEAARRNKAELEKREAEERKRKLDEEEGRRKAAEEERRRKEKAEEDERRKKAEEEQRAKAKAEEEQRAKAKAEEEKKAMAKAEEEKKKAEEEKLAKAKAEEEKLAKAKAEEEKLAKAKAEEESSKKKPAPAPAPAPTPAPAPAPGPSTPAKTVVKQAKAGKGAVEDDVEEDVRPSAKKVAARRGSDSDDGKKKTPAVKSAKAKEQDNDDDEDGGPGKRKVKVSAAAAPVKHAGAGSSGTPAGASTPSKQAAKDGDSDEGSPSTTRKAKPKTKQRQRDDDS